MTARRKAGERREPVFDATPTPGMDLRLDAGDRLTPVSEKSQRSRPPARGRRAANDDDGGAKRKSAGDQPRSSARRGGKGGGGSRSGLRSWPRRLIYWMAVLGLWVAIAVFGLLIWVAAHLPPIQSLEVPKRPPGVQIVSAQGEPLATRGEMGGAAVPLAQLPKYLPQAFVAIEDRRFYSHFGVDPLGVMRAVVANVLRRGVSQGGSTLTQQLAKNLFLTQERTFERKLQEVILALWLEHKFSKTQILDLYLNRVYFGAGAYGVEAASQRYFGKSARSVTLAEAAMLAGLVKSPSKLAPNRNPEGAARRAELVLAAMADAGFVSAEMAKVAAAHPGNAVHASGAGSINYVADWVMDVLDDLIGRIDQDVVVETTVDPALQAAAEKALVEELAQKGTKFAVGQGAFVAMSPDGAVRALVGGRNYAESQYNRAVVAKRQPGSAFKPIVYLTALERGMTPETIRDDRPIDIKGWRPENYGREYAGPVSLSRALALSLNTVAVRLTQEVGPKAVMATAHRLGIASKLEPNVSLGLGTSEVSVLELVGAYAPFANGGISAPPFVVARVRGANGKVLYRRPARGLGRTIDARYVTMMNHMLAETLTIGTARKAELPGWQAAGKTGTSQDFRDAWFVGYTTHLVAGVWLGNDDSSPTRKMTGGGLPVEVWSRFMKAAHKGVPPAELPGVGNRFPAPPAEMPPDPQPSPPPAVVASRNSGGPSARPVAAQPQGLDSWLMDRLFGR